jgi:Flp pilus assembly protein TadD
LVRQASLSAVKAPSFGEGLRLFHAGSFAQAQEAFAAGAASSPDPLEMYFLALTHHKLGDRAAAEAALAQALELERDRPITGWGRRMERVQGHARVWLETARRQAGL